MNDMLENVGLMLALMFAGVGATVAVLVLLIKAFDYMENRDD